MQKKLTEEDIFVSYRTRRMYYITGARTKLIFGSEGELMGSVLTNKEKKKFEIHVTGEAQLKKVELIKRGSIYKFIKCLYHLAWIFRKNVL